MRTYFRSAVAFLTLIAIPPSILGRQASGPAPPSDTLLRVTTHMVLVDVVVVDKSGQPVLNLTQNDFTVLDDGKPQKIASFSVHNPATKKAEAPPVLPPHVATNRPEATMPTAEGTTAVILLDGLNTPPQKQIYLKQQMLKYLAEHFDPSVKLAEMTLTSNVNVLQDFTSNPLLLKAALDRYVAQLPALTRAGGDRDLSASELTPRKWSAA